MTNEDKPRFCVALFWLAKMMPKGTDRNGDPIPRVLTDDFVNGFFEAFRDMHIRRFELGVKQHYAHAEWFPLTPGPLRKSCEQIPRPPEGWLPAPIRPQLPAMPLEKQRELLREVAEIANRKFDTKLSVDENGVMQSNARGRSRDRK